MTSLHEQNVSAQSIYQNDPVYFTVCLNERENKKIFVELTTHSDSQ